MVCDTATFLEDPRRGLGIGLVWPLAHCRALAQRDQLNGGVGWAEFLGWNPHGGGGTQAVLPEHVGWQIDDFGPEDFRDRLGRSQHCRAMSNGGCEYI